jgi:integrase
VLRGIVNRGAPIVSNRVRSLLSRVFNFAIQRGDISTNPVDKTQRPGGDESSRDRVLTRDELRMFWKATGQLPFEMRAAWRLRLLTAQRGGEVLDMRWQDIDLKTGWWTLPSTSTKNKQVHRVPLTGSALTILETLRASADKRARDDRSPRQAVYVLRFARGKRQQAEAAATFAISDFRGHDLRRTAATLMAEAGVNPFHISHVLNHRIATSNTVTAIYNRWHYDREKREALDKLESLVTEIVGQDDDAATAVVGGTAAENVA